MAELQISDLSGQSREQRRVRVAHWEEGALPRARSCSSADAVNAERLITGLEQCSSLRSS